MSIRTRFPPFAVALAGALALAAAASPALAQPLAAVPVDAVLKDFHAIGDYVLLVDGKQVAAEVYQLDQPPTVLVVSPTLGTPVVLSVKERTVETVPPLKVAKNDHGGADILADAVLQPAGRFDVLGSGDVSFKLANRTAVLREKPPLLGMQKLEALRAYNPVYGRLADAYQPSKPIVDRLRAHPTPIQVEVYFGSWCPFCKEMVPRAMKLAQQLAGSRIKVAFYGLPRDISSDAKAKQLEISGVPTGVVYRAGKEIGRINGNSWKIPELAIQKLLMNADASGDAGDLGGAPEEPVEVASAVPGDSPPATPAPEPGPAPAGAVDAEQGFSGGKAVAIAAAVVAVPTLVLLGRRLAART